MKKLILISLFLIGCFSAFSQPFLRSIRMDSVLYYRDIESGDTVLKIFNDSIILRDGTVLSGSSLLQKADSNFVVVTADTAYVDVIKIKDGKTNIKIGDNCGQNISTGSYNVAIGINPLSSLTYGFQNISIGGGLSGLKRGSENISMDASLSNLDTGNVNISLGYNSFHYISKGIGNIGIGYYSGYNLIGERNYNLIINSIERNNINEDTTNAIIYGIQDTTSNTQYLHLNSHVYVKHNLYADIIQSNDSTEITINSPLAIPYYVESFATSKTIDFADGENQNRRTTVTGTTTINFSNIVEGVVYTVHIYMDGTGGHSVTIGTFNDSSGNALNTVTVDMDANELTKIQIEYDGVNYNYALLTND